MYKHFIVNVGEVEESVQTLTEKKAKLGTANALMENVEELAKEGKLQVPIGTYYWLQQLQLQIDDVKRALKELEKKVLKP